MTLPNNCSQESIEVNQTQRITSKRRRRNTSIELEEAGRQMKRAFGTLENCMNNRKGEDEYDYFAKVLANKIRRLPESERELFMYEIDGLYINRLRQLKESSNLHSTSSLPSQAFYHSTSIPGTNIQNRPSSSLTSYSDPEMIMSSRPSIACYSISEPP